MNQEKLLLELDQIYDSGNFRQIEPFLKEKLAEAKEEGDWGAEIMLENERMGLYRELGRTKEAIDVFSYLDEIFRRREMTGTVPYASTLQNAANAYRVDGQLAKAAVLFEEALEIFYQYLEPGDYRFAGIFNNLSLVYMEKKEPARALEYSQKALAIIEKLPDTVIEQATNHVNLADLCCQTGDLEQAERHLEAAGNLFAKVDNVDPHYSSLLSARAEICLRKGKYDEAEELYLKTLSEIERYYGKNRAYRVIEHNLERTRELRKKSE